MTWHWIGSEAGGYLVLIQTSPLSFVDHAVLMLTSFHLHMKGSEVTKQGYLQPRFQSKARSLRTTVRWPIGHCYEPKKSEVRTSTKQTNILFVKTNLRYF